MGLEISSTPKFAHVDTKKPDGFYVQLERIILPDTEGSPTDYLFQDEEYREEDQKRLDAFNRGDWHFLGIRARAHCCIVRGGVGTLVTLDSPGLWGVESDSDEGYFAEVYAEECGTLKDMIAAMRDPIFEELH